ncbi:MAG TPA: amidohydrolase family protein [Candidatus Baltobacteraceae bacterium]|nr:amidohydrolase family protein [Candidatus Baltobacteraceae bacterium]
MKMRIFTGVVSAALAGALLAGVVKADDGLQVPDKLSGPNVSQVIAYSQKQIAIEHVRVIDGTGAPARENQTVLIANGKIAMVGPSGAMHVASGAAVIDGTGKSLMPGIVGTHDHLYYDSGGPLFIVREMPFSFPRLYLAAGVTTIRTTGSIEPYTDLHIKMSIEKGEMAGPHMDVTSPYLTGWEPFFVQMYPLHTPAEARATVNFWADRGMTSFKMYTNMPPAIARAVVAAAHARHLKVLGHLCSIGLTAAANMGVDSLEHGLFVDTEFTPGRKEGECPSDSLAVRKSLAALDVNGPQLQTLLKLLVRKHIEISSTLANFEGANPQPLAVEQRYWDLEDPETVTDVQKSRAAAEKRSAEAIELSHKVFDVTRKFEIAFFRAGGLLTQGPDPTGYGSTIAGLGDQRDMELLVEGGLTPLEAIKVATLNGAIGLGIEKKTGSIVPGKAADLVLIDGDPSKNISDVEKVVTVFKDGIGYDSAKLLESLKGIVGRQ